VQFGALDKPVTKMDRSSKGSQTCFMMTLYANEEIKLGNQIGENDINRSSCAE